MEEVDEAYLHPGQRPHSNTGHEQHETQGNVCGGRNMELNRPERGFSSAMVSMTGAMIHPFPSF